MSAVKAKNMPVAELMREKRNAANDPADYFEYIMFAWGNCQAGDRLVMERALERFPSEEDLRVHFKPGVRFYFKYDHLINHPKASFDGVLPVKVKDEINLSDWVHRIVIPAEIKSNIENCIPASHWKITQINYSSHRPTTHDRASHNINCWLPRRLSSCATSQSHS